MTRKDYELIATALRRPIESFADPVANHAATCAWAQTVSNIADALKAQNVLFNRERFLKACGQ